MVNEIGGIGAYNVNKLPYGGVSNSNMGSVYLAPSPSNLLNNSQLSQDTFTGKNSDENDSSNKKNLLILGGIALATTLGIVFHKPIAKFLGFEGEASKAAKDAVEDLSKEKAPKAMPSSTSSSSSPKESSSPSSTNITLKPAGETVTTAKSASVYCKMTDAEKALLPKELHDTKMGKAMADVIPEMEGLQHEVGYIFNQDGKLIAKTKGVLTNGHFTEEDMAMVSEASKNGESIGMLHNHVIESTLSALDLSHFFGNPYKLMIAKTPNGTAIIQRSTKVVNPEIIVSNINDAVWNEASAELKTLIEHKDNPAEQVRVFNNFKDEQIRRLQEYLPFSYRYEPGLMQKGLTYPSGFDVDSRINECRDCLFNSLVQYGYNEAQAEEAMKKSLNMSLDEFLIPHKPGVKTASVNQTEARSNLEPSNIDSNISTFDSQTSGLNSSTNFDPMTTSYPTGISSVGYEDIIAANSIEDSIHNLFGHEHNIHDDFGHDIFG